MKKSIICIITLLTFSFLSFNCTGQQVNQQIRAIHFNTSQPVVERDSSITNITLSYDVYYYQQLIMYRFPYRFDSLINGELVFQEYRNSYFVFHKDSLFGYKYFPDSENFHIDTTKLHVDSLLKLFSYETTVYDSLSDLRPDSSYNDNEGNLIKGYNHTPEKNRPENYTMYFYYTKKLQGIKETFSKKMDNIKGMKLFRIRIRGKGAYYEEYKMSLPERESLLEMKEIPVENEAEIMEYFDRYKNQF